MEVESQIGNPKSQIELTVIGIGNWLMGDDGVAVRIIERLASDPGGRIEYLDGGEGGLRLLNWIEQAPRLLMVDAARFGGRPGQCRLFDLDEILNRDAPAKPGTPGSGSGSLASGSANFSLHETDIFSVLKLARQFYRCPPTRLLAIQIESVEPRPSLSPPLEQALGRLTRIVRRLAGRLVRKTG